MSILRMVAIGGILVSGCRGENQTQSAVDAVAPGATSGDEPISAPSFQIKRLQVGGDVIENDAVATVYRGVLLEIKGEAVWPHTSTPPSNARLGATLCFYQPDGVKSIAGRKYMPLQKNGDAFLFGIELPVPDSVPLDKEWVLEIRDQTSRSVLLTVPVAMKPVVAGTMQSGRDHDSLAAAASP